MLILFRRFKNRFSILYQDILKQRSLRPIFWLLGELVWLAFRLKSLECAAKEQGLVAIIPKLEEVMPNYKDQFSYSEIRGNFWNYKVRAHHAFQVRLVEKAISKLKNKKKNKKLTIVDIGDSSGTHICYFKKFFRERNVDSLSVNIDPIAVEKIRAKGFEAILGRAEELYRHDVHPDIFVSFQTLEHLNSPITFLKSLSDNLSCKYFVITVPYRRKSRIGLFHIRDNKEEPVHAEKTHIFELNPHDWKLIFPTFRMESYS